MIPLLHSVWEEIANEWGYLLYLALTLWFSVRFLTDRKRDVAQLLEAFNGLLFHMDERLDALGGQINAASAANYGLGVKSSATNTFSGEPSFTSISLPFLISPIGPKSTVSTTAVPSFPSPSRPLLPRR